jgi:cyclomaltodextrinase
MERITRRYAWPIVQTQLNLLDSHDTARFITQAGNDRSALELALLCLMTLPGAPCIYYGTEIGMAGGHDPDCRRAFPWDEHAWDHQLLATVKRAIALRKAHPALRRGQFERFYASDDVCTYGRRLADDAVVMAFNASQAERTFNIDTGDLLADGVAVDLWGGDAVRVSNGILRHVSLPPRSAAVFEIQP